MKITQEYTKYLKDSFYKCLCLFEEDNEGLSTFIKSLQYEFYGLHYVVEQEKTNAIITLVSVLEHFHHDSLQSNPDIPQIRREVFSCINLIGRTFPEGGV